MSAAPIPAAAMTFFIVRDFFSFALFAEVSGWPSVSSIPSASKANLAICPSRRLPAQTPERLGGRRRRECDEPGWFHW